MDQKSNIRKIKIFGIYVLDNFQIHNDKLHGIFTTSNRV